MNLSVLICSEGMSLFDSHYLLNTFLKDTNLKQSSHLLVMVNLHRAGPETVVLLHKN